MNILKYILALYLIVINITAFAMMGIDKKRAKKHEWRIPEARLFGAALLGGGPGAVVGYEIDKKMYQLSSQRLKEETAQMSIFEWERCFNERNNLSENNRENGRP